MNAVEEKKAYRELAFKTPCYHLGNNLTVRRGLKWKNATNEIVFVTGFIKKMARIFKVKVCKFNKIKDEELSLEHDPNCTNKKGLYKAMKVAYPEFKRTDTVCMVYFQIL